jgi:hypothetical protein
MNYRVMKRPMFRIGGGVDSQGTGITSGMDMPRKNYTHGGAHDYDYYKGQIPEAFQSYRDILGATTLMKGAEGLRNVKSIWDIPGALGSPEMLGAVTSGLGTQKALDLKEATTMVDVLKPSSGMWSTRLKSQAAVASLQKRIDALKDSITDDMSDEEVGQINRKIGNLTTQMTVFITGGTIREKAIAHLIDIYGEDFDPTDEDAIQEMIKSLQGYGNAAGGIPTRVNRVGLQDSFAGTVGEGQNVMQGEGAAVQEQAMQPPVQTEQGLTTQQTQAIQQDPYQILRQRLPPEIPDDIVRLIAYNKEAFQDFANIQTQDDVTAFNEKYGVQLVVDVGSV